MNGIIGIQEKGKEEHPKQMKRDLLAMGKDLGIFEDLGKL